MSTDNRNEKKQNAPGVLSLTLRAMSGKVKLNNERRERESLGVSVFNAIFKGRRSSSLVTQEGDENYYDFDLTSATPEPSGDSGHSDAGQDVNDELDQDPASSEANSEQAGEKDKEDEREEGEEGSASSLSLQTNDLVTSYSNFRAFCELTAKNSVEFACLDFLLNHKVSDLIQAIQKSESPYNLASLLTIPPAEIYDKVRTALVTSGFANDYEIDMYLPLFIMFDIVAAEDSSVGNKILLRPSTSRGSLMSLYLAHLLGQQLENTAFFRLIFSLRNRVRFSDSLISLKSPFYALFKQVWLWRYIVEDKRSTDSKVLSSSTFTISRFSHIIKLVYEEGESLYANASLLSSLTMFKTLTQSSWLKTLTDKDDDALSNEITLSRQALYLQWCDGSLINMFDYDRGAADSWQYGGMVAGLLQLKEQGLCMNVSNSFSDRSAIIYELTSLSKKADTSLETSALRTNLAIFSSLNQAISYVSSDLWDVTWKNNVVVPHIIDPSVERSHPLYLFSLAGRSSSNKKSTSNRIINYSHRDYCPVMKFPYVDLTSWDGSSTSRISFKFIELDHSTFSLCFLLSYGRAVSTSAFWRALRGVQSTSVCLPANSKKVLERYEDFEPEAQSHFIDEFGKAAQELNFLRLCRFMFGAEFTTSDITKEIYTSILSQRLPKKVEGTRRTIIATLGQGFKADDSLFFNSYLQPHIAKEPAVANEMFIYISPRVAIPQLKGGWGPTHAG